jgi:hypothetical protein
VASSVRQYPVGQAPNQRFIRRFGITGSETITPPRLTSEPITIPQPSCN